MLIDFHTHTFPDAIAEKTIVALNEKFYTQSGRYLTPVTDGTVSDLEHAMAEQGVDLSVILPIATKASQTYTINKAQADIKSDKVIPFATIHPDNDNKEQILTGIKNAGFAGIKIHPDYQGCNIDSKENIEILTLCEKLGLYTVIHAGVDGGFPPPYHALPHMIKNTLEYVSGKYIIAAHMAGFMSWDAVERYLVGTDIIFDTSMTAGYIDGEQFGRIIHNHGCDRIVFGSDCPWCAPSDVMKLLLNVGLSADELDKIKYKNAAKILGICLDNK